MLLVFNLWYSFSFNFVKSIGNLTSQVATIFTILKLLNFVLYPNDFNSLQYFLAVFSESSILFAPRQINFPLE